MRTPSSLQTMAADIERTAAAKEGEPFENALLPVGQQIVAPVHHRAHRLVAWKRRPRTTCEEPKTVVEPCR